MLVRFSAGHTETVAMIDLLDTVFPIWAGTYLMLANDGIPPRNSLGYTSTYAEPLRCDSS